MVEGEAITFPMCFPNKADGTIEVNVKELQHLLAHGHAKIVADKVRPVTMQHIAKAYTDEHGRIAGLGYNPDKED